MFGSMDEPVRSVFINVTVCEDEGVRMIITMNVSSVNNECE